MTHTGEERELKHRSRKDVRRVPLHPELVLMLRQHLEEFQAGVGGRLFVTRTARAGVPAPPYQNAVSMGVAYNAWHRAREAALTPAQFATPLARRPYDLRHACLSTWLNAGVPVAQVAAWSGQPWTTSTMVSSPWPTSTGVVLRSRATIEPAESTTAARIFGPPMSIPTVSGSHREALERRADMGIV